MSHPNFTAGIDVGDRYSHLCLLDTKTGEVIEESRVSTSPAAMERRFHGCESMRVAIEAGTHSPWISRLLEQCGHEVLVANARKLKLIYGEGKKNDKLDAENLARLARLDPKLLAPLKHRGEASQAHLAIVRSREALVGARTKLVNHARGRGQVLRRTLAQMLGRSLSQENGFPHTGALEAGLGAYPGDHHLADRQHTGVRPPARSPLTRGLP